MNIKNTSQSEKRNKSDYDALLHEVGDKINNAQFKSEPASNTFQDALKQQILEKRHKKQYMSNAKQTLKAIFKPKRAVPVIAGILIIAVVLTTSHLWQFESPEIAQFGKPGKVFSGFSELIVSTAHAEDNFTLTPMDSDSLGVGSDSGYVLTSKEAIDTDLIKKYITVEPLVDYDIKKISDTEWHLLPKTPADPNTLVKVALSTSYKDENGVQKARDYSWAFQIKDSFKVLHSIPRDKGTSVPTDTGIEITFSHDNYKDVEKYFSITPEVQGRFEKHGRTIVFVPSDELKTSTIYTVTVKKGMGVSNSEDALSEDYTFSFETYSPHEYGYDNQRLDIYNNIYEVGSQNIPKIYISAYDIPNNEVQVALYKFSGWQSYLDEYNKRDALPWWSSSRYDYQVDVSNLEAISSFNASILGESYQEYITFPEPLQKGFYITEISSGGDKVQAWIQVSDMAVYTDVTKTDTLVWVNDLISKNPLQDVDVEIINTNFKSKTDGQGILKFETPKEIIDSYFDTDKQGDFYFKLIKDDDALIIPALEQDDYYYYHGNTSIADDFWYYLYTDRPLYQPTDTIKYWGMMKSRDGKPIQDEMTFTLYKEGYVDYYYNPINVAENKIEVDEFGVFKGELELNDVRPDYYMIEVKVGEDVIARKYINIEAYTKPAYQISLIPESKYAFAGDTVKLQGKASFFEGTPVPNLELEYETPDGTETVTTDNQGQVNLEFSRNYYECQTEYSCWPDYNYLSLRPKQSEFAEIYSDTNLHFYGSKVYLNSDVTYPEKGMAQIEMQTNFIDLTKAENDSWWNRNIGDQPAPNTKITGDLIKTTYTKVETGTRYDFIDKKTYKTYRYDKNEEKVDSFSINTDSNGKYIYKKEIEPETSYRVVLKVYDNEGRYDSDVEYLYYYDGNSLSKYLYGDYSYYHLEVPEDAYFDVGDKVDVKFLKNEELLPSGSKKFLFQQYQNGLQEYTVQDDAIYRFKFEERDIPNINLGGVYFTGNRYQVVTSGYFGGYIRYDLQNRAMNIKVTNDKDEYKPGEEVTVKVEATDTKGNPIESEVNLNLIDEAFYALVEDTADPLGSIYRTLSFGTLYSHQTHKAESLYGGAEGGGCFTAGTMILMADGTQKPIEEIEKGDKILTFNNPITKKLVEGEVIETFEHVISNYLVINDDLEVTPEHVVFANNTFMQAGDLKEGDYMMRADGTKEIVNSIEAKYGIVPVYNFTVSPQHTYIANGYYVHNEKGGGPRELFVDAALFQSIKTDKQGKAELTFKLPDNITSWRLTAQGISNDLYAGANVSNIPVSLHVFEEVTIGSDYLQQDKPVARLRAFGKALGTSDNADFSIKAESLGVEQSDTLTAPAFTPVYYSLPELKLGKHDIIYELSTDKGKDAVKLPIDVINSRLQMQEAESSKLTLDTKIENKNNRPVVVVLSDNGQNQLYMPLHYLSWTWGDRVDQKLPRVQSRDLLQKYYGEEIYKQEFNAFNYQDTTGGITLLPYSSSELELSALVASVGAQGFDKESLSQYFFKVLEDKNSTPEQISISLFGLASLEKPVLPRIEQWLQRDDLSIQDRIYIAQSLVNLGASEKARTIYNDIIENNSESKEPHMFINVGDTDDHKFRATISMAVLASSLNTEHREGLWNYVIENQILYGDLKNSEQLYNLEKLKYISTTLPQLKPSPAKVTYELFGDKNEVEITGGYTHSFQLEPNDVDKVKFTEIQGDVGVSARYTVAVDLQTVERDQDISIKREYYVNGVKTDTFKETDLIEVRLYPKFSAKALEGRYQITDFLPSGLMPVTKLYRWNSSYDCGFWYPYNTEGQMVKYSISKDWNGNYCGQDYIKYYARVKTKGEYKAEPVILQSFMNPDYVNYSEEGIIVID